MNKFIILQFFVCTWLSATSLVVKKPDDDGLERRKNLGTSQLFSGNGNKQICSGSLNITGKNGEILKTVVYEPHKGITLVKDGELQRDFKNLRASVQGSCCWKIFEMGRKRGKMQELALGFEEHLLFVPRSVLLTDC